MTVEDILPFGRGVFSIVKCCFGARSSWVKCFLPIKRKTHGRFEKSLLKHGLDYLTQLLHARENLPDAISCFHHSINFLSVSASGRASLSSGGKVLEVR